MFIFRNLDHSPNNYIHWIQYINGRSIVCCHKKFPVRSTVIPAGSSLGYGSSAVRKSNSALPLSGI